MRKEKKYVNLKNKNHCDPNNLPVEIVPKSKNYDDLRNKKFGHLVALYPCGYLTKEKRLAWLCQCDCTNKTYLQVTAKNLKNGSAQSCGCLHKQRATQSNINRGKPIEIGNRYGKLTVMKDLGLEERPNGKHRKIFQCKCDCGNIVTVAGVYLNTGETNSCGCLRSKGEQEIMALLNRWQVLFKPQYTFNDFKTENNHYYRFDFGLVTKSHELILIEYQGDIHFHYSESEHSWNTKGAFEQRVKRDAIKKRYCLKNNIPLYEISYLDNVEEKLKEILCKEGLYIE